MSMIWRSTPTASTDAEVGFQLMLSDAFPAHHDRTLSDFRALYAASRSPIEIKCTKKAVLYRCVTNLVNCFYLFNT